VVEAHRSHAYQRLSRHWQGHRPVTLAFTAANVFWLAPWAFVAARSSQHGSLCALVALLPLVLVATSIGAGRPGEIGTRATVENRM
jgi:Fuc2NAc and GlcNAc transferase